MRRCYFFWLDLLFSIQAFVRAFVILEAPCLRKSRTALQSLSEPTAVPASDPAELLIHWKGEDVEGYSQQFRHVEFRGALSAVLPENHGTLSDVVFEDALSYSGDTVLSSQLKLDSYNQAMQYLKLPETVPLQSCVEAVRRCSLVHALYMIVCKTSTDDNSMNSEETVDTYSYLCQDALDNGGFEDMYSETDSWCVRARHYGKNVDSSKEVRYGHRARSLRLERKVLLGLKPLLLKFAGKVDLERPNCKIYVFEGLVQNAVVLTRRLTVGRTVSSIDPNTRICVTNTPLCPIAAFCLNNVAQIRAGDRILDPFCGSGATLLAAAMIDPTVTTVGIEIAHDGHVNRTNILEDFGSRHLTPPAQLLHGDAGNSTIRHLARDGQTFDAIVTDPPYGIRESTGFMDRPVDELFRMITMDRDEGNRLLKIGGRLVVFLPHQIEEESLEAIMPTAKECQDAGLAFELKREQPLNDVFSRWLVSFLCIDNS